VPAIVVTKPVEVQNRLAQLGWRREQLLEVVGAMVAARNNCTDNDPASARGWMAWKEGTRRMREIGTPMGMHRQDIEQIPWTVDLARGLKFAVANTDDATGIEARTPQNRSRKGPGTERAVNGNQGWLFEDVPQLKVVPISRAGRQPGIRIAWFLCVYAEGDDIRAELSCPVATESGFFTDFVERIVLIGPDSGHYLVSDQDIDGGDGEFDIPVSRK